MTSTKTDSKIKGQIDRRRFLLTSAAAAAATPALSFAQTIAPT